MKLLLRVAALNVVRYVVAGPIEALLILGPIRGAMEASEPVFNTQLTRWDWITRTYTIS